MKTYRVHFFMLYLIDYEDGRVVFKSGEKGVKGDLDLKGRKEKFKETLLGYGCTPDDFSDREDFKVCNIKKYLSNQMSLGNNKFLKADIGFYHHRIITHVEAECSEKEMRCTRDSLPANIKSILDGYKSNVNESSVKGKILDYFEYQLIIVESSRDVIENLEIPFSMQTTSLSFDIIKPTLREEKMLVRISLPCTAIYGDIQVEKDKVLVRNFINAIYQCALYGRKKRLAEMQTFTSEDYKLDEQDLQELWMFMTESMGGKLSHLFSFKVNRGTFILTIVVVLLTVCLLADIIYRIWPWKFTGW